MEASSQRAAAPLRRTASSRFAFTTTRPVAILMVVLAIAVFGWVSYNRLALTLMPDISYPTLTVRTEYVGAAPEELETLLTRPVEEAVGVVKNVRSIRSVSRSERGTEETVQGWSVTPLWPAALGEARLRIAAAWQFVQVGS